MRESEIVVIPRPCVDHPAQSSALLTKTIQYDGNGEKMILCEYQCAQGGCGKHLAWDFYALKDGVRLSGAGKCADQSVRQALAYCRYGAKTTGMMAAAGIAVGLLGLAVVAFLSLNGMDKLPLICSGISSVAIPGIVMVSVIRVRARRKPAYPDFGNAASSRGA